MGLLRTAALALLLEAPRPTAVAPLLRRQDGYGADASLAVRAAGAIKRRARRVPQGRSPRELQLVESPDRERLGVVCHGAGLGPQVDGRAQGFCDRHVDSHVIDPQRHRPIVKRLYRLEYVRRRVPYAYWLLYDAVIVCALL